MRNGGPVDPKQLQVYTQYKGWVSATAKTFAADSHRVWIAAT
jgi:hypothetical protein